jgi:hypothetical protein
MERGWTMVISGSVMAAGGALLAGIATAVARLQMLEGEFARLSDRLGPSEAPAFSLPPDMGLETVPSAERRVPPLAPVPDLGEHKDLDIAPEPILASPPAERPRAEAPPAIEADANDELFDLRGPEPSPSERKEEPAPAEADEAAPAEADEEGSPPTVVGTYNSGGNFYIMYSDGSIEAETPAGKFRFGSLDELKDFIAAGGDRPKAAAPV